MYEKSFRSKFLLNFYKKFDMPVRFFYTRIPVVRDVAQRLTFKLLYKSSHKKVFRNYTSIKTKFEKHGMSFKDMTVIEIGPGTSLILALCLLHDGAKKIILLDRFPRWDHNIINQEVEYLENKRGMDVRKYLDENMKPKNEYFQYVKNSVENMIDVESNSVNLITSFGVLEHIRDSESAFSEMYRVLKKKGVLYHFISLGDHYNFNDPMRFLKYPDWLWNIITKEGYSYTNRLRVDDYLEIINAQGFKIIDSESIVCDESKLGRINSKFASKRSEDIRTTHSYLLVQK